MAEEQVVVSSENPVKEAKLGFAGISVGIVFIAIILFALNYFNILRLSTKLPHQKMKSSQQVQKVVNKIPTPTSVPSSDHAVDLNSLNMLTYWQKGVVISANMTMELDGTIINIDDTNGTFQEHGSPPLNYVFKIKLVGENNETNDFFLTQDDLQKTKFEKANSTGDNNELISYKELKVQDMVRIIMILDLTKEFSNNFVSATVIKLN